MSSSIHRRINNEIKSQERKREQALQKAEEYISSQFQDGSETVSFRFDAFSLWGKGVEAKELWAYLREQDLYTDNWCRAVWDLTKEQAIEIGRLVEEWNADWEEEINPFSIGFSLASGTEHVISVFLSRHSNDSWQW